MKTTFEAIIGTILTLVLGGVADITTTGFNNYVNVTFHIETPEVVAVKILLFNLCDNYNDYADSTTFHFEDGIINLVK